LGRFDDAIAEYQRVLAINPNHAMARYHLATAYDRKSQHDLARTEYQQFLDVWKDADADIPEVVEARRHLAAKVRSSAILLH
jgi:Flp pilus assembly protein TadD